MSPELLNSFHFLSDASRLFSASLDFEITLRNTAKLVVDAVADWCVIDLFHEGKDLDRIAVAHADPTKKDLASRLKKFHLKSDKRNPYVAEIVNTGKPVIVPNVSEEQLAGSAQSAEHLALLKEFKLKSRINMPLVSRDKTLGILSIGWVENGKNFKLSNVSIIEDLGQRIAQAIDNALLYHKACEAVQAREDFISIASHELKTPLTALQMRLEVLKKLLQRDLDKNKITAGIDSCLKQSFRMGALIDVLLEIARIEQAQFTLNLREVMLVDLVKDVTDRFCSERAIDRSQLIVEIKCNQKVLWDPGRIDQVLTNLISNAFKYGDGKPIHVTIEDAPNSKWILLSIRDQGIGIPVEYQKRIFERFERAPNTGPVAGLGLGLYITKKIVENHGGNIHLESKVGAGSQFNIELPVRCKHPGSTAA